MNPQMSFGPRRSSVVAASLIALLSLCGERLVAQTTTCSAPASPGVNICSPANGSIISLQRLANDQLATAVTISAAGTNTNGTAGMDVWLDGVKLGFFAHTAAVDINLSMSGGTHQLDIYAVGVDGELKAQTSFFRVDEQCLQPVPPGVNICSPANGLLAALPFAISAEGANTGGTAGMDVWLDGVKLGFFSNTAEVNFNAIAAPGPHQLDIYARSADWQQVSHQTSSFTVLAPDCGPPASPDVTFCSPGNGFTEASPIDIVAFGRNAGPTEGMDVWLDGTKLGFFKGKTVSMTNVQVGLGSHQLDIYAVGINSATELQSSSFTVVPCALPASGVHTCSPANPFFPLPLDLQPDAGYAETEPNWVTSAFSISAAGRNINGTAGMDVWLDGNKLDFFANTPTVNIENVRASQGKHQLDIYAVGVDGEKAVQKTLFSVCPIPGSPGVNICQPLNGENAQFAFEIVAAGRNTGPTAGLDVWLNGRKIGFFPGNFAAFMIVPSGFGTQPVPAELDIFAVGVNGELKSSSVVFNFDPAP